MRKALPVFVLAASFVTSVTARAEPRVTVPAGGGLPAMDVRVDLAAGSVVVGATSVPIGMDRARLPAESDVVVEAVPLGGGRSVSHVVVPSKDQDGTAWEALWLPGQTQPLFAGLTGFVGGDPGERTGKAVKIVRGADRSFVLLGDIREDLRLCGQSATLLDPQAIYPTALELRSATVQRLEPDQLAGSRAVTAVSRGKPADPALAQLLVARGSSVDGSRGAELTDGNPATVWSEDRPGMGQGEFVVMAAPRDVPIARLQIVVSPPAPAPAPAPATLPTPTPSPAPTRDGAAPHTFFLTTDTLTYAVTLPADAWSHPGEAYEIALPQPLQTSCVALVLGDATTRGLAHPRVGIAELTAYSELDAPGATLADAAKQLSGARGDVAAQVLERAGAGAFGAVEAAYDGLDARGRARAIDVAASHARCEESAPLLVKGLCEASGEAPRKAHEKLERCKGAAPVLAARLRDDAASRVCVAPELAALAGPGALEPLADALAATPMTDVPTRVVLRGSFAQALRGAPAGTLAPLLGDGKRSPQARVEMMRAAGARVGEARSEGDASLTQLLGATPSVRDRYVALGPLAELARGGDTTATGAIVNLLARDPEWPVRAHAADAAHGVPSAEPALLAAARDPEPRVREAAFQALRGSTAAGVADAARVSLASESWPFVKIQAIGLLARAGASSAVDDGLVDALGDGSFRVRGATLLALALRRVTRAHDAVRSRLDDVQEDTDVRTTAARVLGALCDTSSLDRLTEIVERLATPGASEEEQQIALGALDGLAVIHPSDLASRLGPLRAASAPPSVRGAAERALAARGACH